MAVSTAGTGPTILDVSRRRTLGGADRPTWKLYIDNRDYSSRLIYGTINYPADGASSFSFAVGDHLRGQENAKVVMRLGYGKRTFGAFTGKLEEARDADRIVRSEAVAYGPGKLMGEAKFGVYKRFELTPLDVFYNYLIRKTEIPSGRAELRGSSHPALEDYEFALETTMLEAEREVFEDVDYVAFDTLDGTRVGMPRPLPALGAPPRVTYTESSYPREGLSIDQGRKNAFAAVHLYRAAGTSGGIAQTYEVDAYRPVTIRTGSKPNSSQIYTVADYRGSQAKANREATYLARVLGSGLANFSIRVRPGDINPYDSVIIQTTERMTKDRLISLGGGRGALGPRQNSGYVRATYQGIVDQGVTFNIRKKVFNMTLQGTAIKIAEQPIPVDRRLLLPRLSGGVVPLPAPGPLTDWLDWGDGGDILFDELTHDYSEYG